MVDSEKGRRMNIETPFVPAPSNDLPVAGTTEPLTGAVAREEGFYGDFATGERTGALTQEETQEENLHGDFAAGERTAGLTQDETVDEGLHGDFAAGERTEPVTLVDETPGTFGDTGQ
jgi:hypothetical protein